MWDGGLLHRFVHLLYCYFSNHIFKLLENKHFTTRGHRFCQSPKLADTSRVNIVPQKLERKKNIIKQLKCGLMALILEKVVRPPTPLSILLSGTQRCTAKGVCLWLRGQEIHVFEKLKWMPGGKVNRIDMSLLSGAWMYTAKFGPVISEVVEISQSVSSKARRDGGDRMASTPRQKWWIKSNDVDMPFDIKNTIIRCDFHSRRSQVF